MSHLKIWAPYAGDVGLEIEGGRLAFSKEKRGWWGIDSDLLVHGRDYAVVIDGKKPVPDPRSPWQPFGTEGPSRFIDHSIFPWTDRRWQPGPLSSAVIYELHTGTFHPSGTFSGIEERLDHLIDLGVTHIELMPVNGFPGTRGWGYDGVDLFAPQESYGGPVGLKRLVNTCHDRGLAVILDVVYNHLGPSGNYLEWFGPYYNERYHTPWGRPLNFDGPESEEVRRFFCDNALMWLRDYHIDGLRIDAVHAIYDRSALHFLEQLAEEVDALKTELGRSFFLIAESDLNNPRIVERREVGGYGIDAQWSDDFRHALHAVLTGERNGIHGDFGLLSDLGKAMKQAFVYDGRYSRYRRRRHGRPPVGLSGHRFLAYLQTHDQIGNRGRGERSSHLIGIGRLKIAAGLIFASPFIPMLFQGEEWGASTPFQYFTDHQDPELGKAVSEGRRNEFAAYGWNPSEIPDPQDPETFERSKLKWEERDHEPHRSILEWHKRLIRLRRRVPALKDGRLDRVRVDWDEEKKWLVMERGAVSVACNIAPHIQTVPLRTSSPGTILLASENGISRSGHGIELPPNSIAILGGAGPSK